MDIRDKVAIITGASAGIGMATATALAREGAAVVVVARSAETLERVAGKLIAEGHAALPLPADLRDAKQTSAMIRQVKERFGRIDILVNNAGQAAAGLVADVSLEDFRQIVELNVYGPLRAMQAVIPIMRESGGGVIVNVSSMVSKLHIPGLGAYAATKAALNLLSETARFELESEKIRVITMFPRTTATDFGTHSLGNQALRQQQRGHAAANVIVDPPEAVARKIVEAIQGELPEHYMGRPTAGRPPADTETGRTA